MAVPSHLRSAVLAAALGIAGLHPEPAWAAADPVGAAEIFREATALCSRDAGALWGHTLCGPIMLVDPSDSAIVANQPDAGGVLKASGAHFVGTLPPTEIMANTTVRWSGTRWTELLWPLPGDPAQRRVMIAHELFHRIQVDLKMAQRDGGNQHLDSLEGRILLQLEWLALARSLSATAASDRRSAIADALLFRHERHRLYPGSAAEEGALELNEGVSEYTGVRIGLDSPRERTAYALRDLSAFLDAPTFVRTFAYATGPAYGLLLDQADPSWRTRLASGQRLDQLLAAALHLRELPPAEVRARETSYDPALRPREVKRDQDRRKHLAALRARLVDGPVLTLPVLQGSYQFNPLTLQPLGDAGTVYPTLRLSAAWGVLDVEQDALMDKAMKVASVSAAGFDQVNLKGDGWRLTLNEGWTVRPGARKGDLAVTRIEAE